MPVLLQVDFPFSGPWGPAMTEALQGLAASIADESATPTPLGGPAGLRLQYTQNHMAVWDELLVVQAPPSPPPPRFPARNHHKQPPQIRTKPPPPH